MPLPSERTAPSAASIEEFVAAAIAERLGTAAESVDRDEPFANFGLSSKDAVVLSGKLGEWLDRRLPATLLWTHPTTAALAIALAAGAEEDVSVDNDSTATPTVVREPTAIVGIGCRYTDIRGPGEFWRVLRNGMDLVAEPGPSRLEWPHPERVVAREGYQRWYGAFLDQPYSFDAGYFGISGEEAARMDPQQRILLETIADTLDDAGIPPAALAGTETGVFVGVPPSDYARPRMVYPDVAMLYATGNSTNVVSGRVSYQYDLHGPSVSVDTACSSSLVATHLALRALAAGDCTQAIVAGVNLTLDPFLTDCLSEAGFLAADGRCKTFDEKADGYVRSEGCGAVLLKPLSRALADGDRVYAVLAGSAVNQDGRTNGLTAPSQRAQELVLARAYRDAGLSPADVQYVELHGTGTPLGDPIEAHALGAVFAHHQSADRELLVGAAKSNVGHTEAASGITGLIKTALAVYHREIPPNLHFTESNPLIRLEELRMSVVTTPTPWPDASRRVAGVSSFGWSGTNAHVVVAEAPAGADRAVAGRPAGRLHLTVLSAQTEDALVAAAGQWIDGVDESVDIADLAHTATTRRGHHAVRAAMVVADRAELTQCLRSLRAGSVDGAVAVGRRMPGHRSSIAFAFTGQGNQWFPMARDLIRSESTFRDALLAVDRPLRRALRWSPFALLDRGTYSEQLGQTEWAQPTIFAIQVALVELWRSWGITPRAVIGHSMGEIAAAYVAGVLQLDEACQIVAARATALAPSRGSGRMALIGRPAAVLRSALASRGDVSVAAENGPRWTLLSGTVDGITAAAAELVQDGAAVRILDGEYPFHGPGMSEYVAPFRHRIAGHTPREGELAVYSTVTGGRISGTEMDADYWAREITAPVRFTEAMTQLLEHGYLTVVEVGPDSVLTPLVEDIMRDASISGVALSSLRRKLDGRRSMLAAAGRLYTQGYELDWAAVNGSGATFAPDLPLYPFQRRDYRTEAMIGAPTTVVAPSMAGAATETGTAPATPDRPAGTAATDVAGSGVTPLRIVSLGHVPPRTAHEREIAAIWEELLAVAPVGATDDFLSLGGNSLLALQFVGRMETDFGVQMPLDQLAQGPTVAQVAELLDQLVDDGVAEIEQSA